MSRNKNQIVNQAIVTAQAELDPNLTSESIALFNEDGSPIDLNSGPGGGVDLSAVDQDVTLLNGHSLILLGDTNPLFRCSIANVFDRLTVIGSEDDEITTLRVSDPIVPEDNFVQITAEDGEAALGLVTANSGDLGSGTLWVVPGKPNTLQTVNIEFTSGGGPILIAPDASRHRLIVANDGSLSTEPVT